MYEEALIGVALGFVFAYFAREKWQQRRIERLQDENEELQDELISAKNTVSGAVGNQARRDKLERQQAAMLEFAQAVQGGQKTEEVLKAMVGKYPDVAFDLAKKGFKL